MVDFRKFLKEAQEKKRAEEDFAHIPFVKDKNGIGVDTQPVLESKQRENPEKILGIQDQVEDIKPLSDESFNKAVGKLPAASMGFTLPKLSSNVTIAPKALPAKSQEGIPAQIAEKPKVAGIAGTALQSTRNFSIDSVAAKSFGADTQVFDRGVEKYTDEEVKQIKGALEHLIQSFEKPEFVGGSLKLIMQQLLSNPNLTETLGEQDIGMMVRALRLSHGVHVQKSDDRATKYGDTKAMKNRMANAVAELFSTPI